MQDQPNNAGVVAPPPLIFAAFLIVGLLADYFMPVWSLAIWLRALAFLVFVVCGVILAVITFARFRDAETSANPYRSVSTIIRDGPFGHTRNPLYVALCLFHIGISFGFGGLFSLLTLVPVLAVMHFGVILREESYLEREFGEDYLSYKREVRRWL